MLFNRLQHLPNWDRFRHTDITTFHTLVCLLCAAIKFLEQVVLDSVAIPILDQLVDVCSPLDRPTCQVTLELLRSQGLTAQSPSVGFQGAEIGARFGLDTGPGFARVPSELVEPVDEPGSPDARGVDSPCDFVNREVRFP